MRKCPLTNSEYSSPFFSSSDFRVMTSDQRISEGQLKKIIFDESGIVANENALSSEDLDRMYGEEYKLNNSGGEEHIFYTKEGPIPRSLVYFEWIEPFLRGNHHTVIEIGCGEGNVLARIAESFPEKKVLGFDGNYQAVELGRKKQLNITQKIFASNEVFPRADLYLLIGVLEHVEDIKSFLFRIAEAINEHGKIVICIPIQNYGGYDIFFSDHIWHFTVKQFEYLLNELDLRLTFTDSNHPINYGFGLFICEKGKAKKANIINDSDIMFRNLHFWQDAFVRIDNWFNGHRVEKVAVFGASEVFTLFMAYSSLATQNITACIDDTKKPGDKKHGIPIYHSEWLEKNPVDLLLLAVNKKYHEIIKEKFKDLKLNMQPIY